MESSYFVATRRAEEEQVRLKDAVDDQAIYLATLRALVPKHLYDWIAITETTRAAIVSSHQVNMQANHVLFAEHLRQVFSAYTQVGTVFGGIDLTTMPDGMTTSGRSPNADEALGYFRHFNKCTLPFSFKQTHEAWWNMTNLNQWLQDGDGYANLADPNDTVILRLHLVRTLPTGITVSIKQRYILRRFVEETRAVFMWKTYSEGEGPFTGFFVEETGWAHLQPSTDGSTIVGVCVDQAPMQLNASKLRTTDSEQFYSLMQSLLKENAEVFTHILSKKLMEETLFD
ncbi:hypothetical protein PHPALM_30702 [Phytophthora palmivora]|uniref:Uncharacterized protein n=1 Tax=Phytophthora palmivora TaxID=4796 RepID=A0A2P4X4H6_9STRA|nr:hypothetical protein PHPALM_30702 [Phytophthora palmivora]